MTDDATEAYEPTWLVVASDGVWLVVVCGKLWLPGSYNYICNTIQLLTLIVCHLRSSQRRRTSDFVGLRTSDIKKSTMATPSPTTGLYYATSVFDLYEDISSGQLISWVTSW